MVERDEPAINSARRVMEGKQKTGSPSDGSGCGKSLCNVWKISRAKARNCLSARFGTIEVMPDTNLLQG
jgi:hypothetical protein